MKSTFNSVCNIIIYVSLTITVITIAWMVVNG